METTIVIKVVSNEKEKMNNNLPEKQPKKQSWLSSFVTDCACFIVTGDACNNIGR